MNPIPRPALFLGLAGLVPFLWGTATQVSPLLAEFGLRWLGPRFIGPYVGLAYGTIILAFMSGALWGFVASRARGKAAAYGYTLSVLPALWAFFFVGNGPVSAAIWLAAGFAVQLLIDGIFWERGLAPSWWMRLRVGLTVVVIACLSVTILT